MYLLVNNCILHFNIITSIYILRPIIILQPIIPYFTITYCNKHCKLVGYHRVKLCGEMLCMYCIVPYVKIMYWWRPDLLRKHVDFYKLQVFVFDG